MPNGAGPGHSVPRDRACAGGGLSAGASAVLQPWHKVTTRQAPHALAAHGLTVILPAGAPCAKGLLAFGASPPARRRDLLEETSLHLGTASPRQAMHPPELLEPRTSLLTAPPLSGQEAVFLRAAVPLGIS